MAQFGGEVAQPREEDPFHLLLHLGAANAAKEESRLKDGQEGRVRRVLGVGQGSRHVRRA